MTRDIEITEEAYQDLADSWGWYEDQRVGLGEAFLIAFRETTRRVMKAPEAYTQVETDVRRAMMRRFP